jgi:hypothetical protein
VVGALSQAIAPNVIADLQRRVLSRITREEPVEPALSAQALVDDLNGADRDARGSRGAFNGLPTVEGEGL